jgi:hypothetical protein
MPIDERLFSKNTIYVLKSVTRGRNYSTLIPYDCNVPSRTLLIDSKGNCYACNCELWLPITIDNILSFQKLADFWQHPRVLALQEDINLKKFTYCAVNHCGITQANHIGQEYKISINMDESCNLACPSCRRELIHHKSGLIFDTMTKHVDHLVKLLESFEEPVEITMSGNGDPLASLIMRPLFLNWQPSDNQKIVLFTNGLLIKKMLPDSKVWPHISKFKISVDAGSADVYENVRRPGKFWALQENLSWLAQNRRPDTEVQLQFCVSAPNATDIINFAEMCNHYGFNGHIAQLDNLETFDDFSSQDVLGNLSHENHESAMAQLREVQGLPHITLSGQILSRLRNKS